MGFVSFFFFASMARINWEISQTSTPISLLFPWVRVPEVRHISCHPVEPLPKGEKGKRCISYEVLDGIWSFFFVLSKRLYLYNLDEYR